MAKEKPDNSNTIAVNKVARHRYTIIDTFEAGVALVGSEVKSLRNKKVNLKEGYATVRKGELFLDGVHISPYKEANQFNHNPLRTRKLLMHRNEIHRLQIETEKKQLTLIPLKLYFTRGKVKLALGLGKPKKLHDKRQDLRKADDERMMDRAQKKRR